MKDKTIKLEDLTGALGIKAQAKRDGIEEVTVLAESGEGDNRVTVYRYGDVRVADTNGDPVWEESDPVGFEELMEECGIKL